MPIKEKEIYTVEEFANKIERHRATVYNWVEKGWIPADTTSGIKIPKLEVDLVREISILTNKKYPVVWECMKEYICSLKDTFENVLERKGHGQVIKEITEIVKKKK
jgi:hypothetical protein